MKTDQEQWVEEWERYTDTRHCPACQSERIADITVDQNAPRARPTTIENCLNCDWRAPESGIGFCDSDANETILNRYAQS